MNLLPSVLLLTLILALLGCGGGPPATTTKAAQTGYEFQRLCSTLGSQDGRISRQQLLAQAKDKEAAAQLFDACDANRDNFLTEPEATSNASYFESLKNQVILFHTTRP
jgi:hypothetical protein